MTPIAIAVVEHEGRFLIGQRPEGIPLAGLWEFPGGKIQPGETPETAAVRECLEETGLAVTPLFRYPEHIEHYAHGEVHLHFIACRPAGGSDELGPALRWVPRDQLAGYEFPRGNAGLLRILTKSEDPTGLCRESPNNDQAGIRASGTSESGAAPSP
jgi:8-oxo-dGTP diphosphatase